MVTAAVNALKPARLWARQFDHGATGDQSILARELQATLDGGHDVSAFACLGTLGRQCEAHKKEGKLMSRGRIAQREVRRFWAVGTTGQRYQLVDQVDLLDARAFGNSHAAPVEGLHEIQTSDGLSVNFLGNGRYEIVQTGEILTEK